ncbi:leucine-rich repeat-containing protein 34 isoform X2 [Antechinus flavipes]|uniref:leucine-rich repeat-containing protein 34 isoform X1 n=1 Tax=Antechinus flavipes TaxID=38775 RepID=UPI002236567D|nr:leucine-rich repeat-containing protein 34 isoform X1 [Antechinus flavipes]XP_051839108.1 leucine-rich repeat-containing protein 34 isoform X2 [Antechinus flavipes]
MEGFYFTPLPMEVTSTFIDLPQNYQTMCQLFQREENPFLLKTLQLQEAYYVKNDKGLRDEITIKVAGNDHLITPVQRLKDEDFEVLLYTIKPYTNITGLDVRYNLITDYGVIHVVKLLEEIQNITYLNLMFNDIETKGGEMIAKALHRNTTLKYLRMTGNKIGNKGGMFFATMLQINSSLEKLDLGDCDLEIQSLIALATVLTKNKSMKGINLNRPLLKTEGEESTVHISNMLRINSSLIEIHLCKHDMKNFGMEQLCKALLLNTTLRYLDVSCNRITRDAMKYLGELLKRNNVLEVIDLSSNRIEDEGSLYLTEALAFYNTSLKALSIVSNNISGEGLIAFSDALKTNTTLSNLYIWGNKFDSQTCEAFSNLIKSGRLKLENIDVEPYIVDNLIYFAELSHGIKKHYYWTPSYGEIEGASTNAGFAIVTTTPHL